jgi:hypothetical protein
VQEKLSKSMVDILISKLKEKLNITWEDVSTENKLLNIVEDAKITLNHKLGAEIDYSKPGMERTLFMNYCLYVWSDCANEFDKNYLSEIYQIRNKYKVKRYVENKAEI